MKAIAMNCFIFSILFPINRKIRTFLDWKVFGPEFTRNMSRLFEVRNDTVHCISINEVSYNPKSKTSLSTASGFQRFTTDFQKAWKELLKIYVAEQEKLDLKKTFYRLGFVMAPSAAEPTSVANFAKAPDV